MGYVSAVYFSNWSVYEAKHFANNLPVNKVSHVFYAFMKIDAKSGSVSLSDQWADTQLPMQDGLKGSLSVLYALKKKHRSLKVVMSIGGWGTHDAFVGVMKKSYRIKNFVSTAISLVKKYKFDGIDIDWEYPGNSKEAMQMVHLLSMLRESLTAISPDLILTVAAPAIPDKISKLLVANMDRYLTFWNIMCYDFSGEAWSTLTGYHSNLFGANGANELNGDEAIEKYISLGVEPNKLVLGMPMYGRSFSRPVAPCPGASFCPRPSSTESIVDYRSIDRSEEVYDEVRVAAFAFDKTKSLLVTYDNSRSATIKARYVVQKGLRGGFWWDSKGDTDNHSLVTAFVDALDGGIDTQKNRL